MNWKNLEETVHRIASYQFNSVPKKDRLVGVDLDCVIKDDEKYIVIEITKNETLQKWREDLAKLTIVRLGLMQQGFYCKCFFITEEEPTQAIVDGAKQNHIEALSLRQFELKIFNYPAYVHARNTKAFGSSVVPVTGDPDKSKFVPVTYKVRHHNQEFTVEEIAQHLTNGGNAIIIGNFGTGKSRLVSELFGILSKREQPNQRATFAIDMRQLWGIKRHPEILYRHFSELGVSSLTDPVLKMLNDQALIFLLDGFDEFGTQVWSDDPKSLRQIRFESLAGVRGLISNSKTGILVTGREHYFNNDDEMLEALGMPKDTILLECADEFTDEAMKQYLAQINTKSSLPKWLPKKPLICQIIGTLEKEDQLVLFEGLGSGYSFWHNLIALICEREARINDALRSETIKQVYLRLARFARSKAYKVGPFTQIDLNRAFREVVGTDAVDASATMLQRLAALGRVSADSQDRQFVDDYILNGLQAEDTFEVIEAHSDKVRDSQWAHSLNEPGLLILSDALFQDYTINEIVKKVHTLNKYKNTCLVSDIVGASLVSSCPEIDFLDLEIRNAEIVSIDLTDKLVKGLRYEDCVIHRILIHGAKVENVSVKSSEIGCIVGMTAGSAIPTWIEAQRGVRVEAMNTVSRIKKAELSNVQRVLVTIIQKTFFQRGSGRKEEALLRGLGSMISAPVQNRILNILLSAQVLTKTKGDSGILYHPVRNQTKRMSAIIAELNQSIDVIWKEVSALG